MATKQPRGRPARPMPPKIDASPEEIAEVVLGVPYKEVVALLEQDGNGQQEKTDVVPSTLNRD